MNRKVTVTLAGAALGLIALAGCGSSGGSAQPTAAAPAASSTEVPSSTATTGRPTTTTTVAPATTQAPTTTAAPTTTVAPTTTTEPSKVIPAGTYVVGDEIAPGQYRVAGYWARLDANQEIIDNDVPGDGNFSILQVQPTDAYVKLSAGALAWVDTKPVDPVATGKTGGTYLVGFDLAPGRYSVSPVDGHTYWARLDAKGEIIDNDVSDGRSIVTVKPGDWALKFSGTLAPLP